MIMREICSLEDQQTEDGGTGIWLAVVPENIYVDGKA